MYTDEQNYEQKLPFTGLTQSQKDHDGNMSLTRDNEQNMDKGNCGLNSKWMGLKVCVRKGQSGCVTVLP